jgi:hypothetical protein
MLKRLLTVAVVAALLVPAAYAHFVFVIPDKAGDKASVVFSDALEPDPDVDIAKINALALTIRDAAGAETALKHTPAKNALDVELPGGGPRVVYGTVKYGVLAKGGAKPYLLTYHPKAIVGAVAPERSVVGEKLPAELVPVVEGEKVKFKLLGAGKPVADAEVTVIRADKSEKVKTGADGLTPAFDAKGRFGVWSKVTAAKAGEHDGKKYEEARDYATLVYDAVPVGGPPLPVGVSSLGAIACDGHLYVYGGHAGKTHSYDTKSVLGTFHRLKLDGGTAWEALPGGPIAQGMNLAAHGGKVYRVGGMSPRNAPGEPADNVSLADCAAFDPKTGTWSELPPMPAGRSSHDVVVAGDKLVVVGGWQMRGKGQSPVWHETTLTLDLSAASPKWESIPQPFQRRALAAAVSGSKVYVIAGMNADAAAVRTVNVLDTATGKWTTGPDLPGTNRVGFSPAAATVGGRVVVNTSAGGVYRLTEAGDAWEQVGEAATRRMVARLIPHGPRKALLVGGASGGANATMLEVLTLSEM